MSAPAARRPPYLPFLNGPPRLTVGLAPIEPARWIDPDTEARALAEKRALLATRRDEVFRESAGSAPAQQEAGELIAAARGRAPMSFLDAGLTVSDDLCVMEARDGVWRLTAALLCAPSFWSLADNIGGPLAHLHGPVPDSLGPDGAQGLPRRIARMFSALQPDQILERFNWTVQAGPDRFAPRSEPLAARAAAAALSEAGALLHLRVERQTIRRLPRTGAILFTIRVCIDPLREALAQAGARDAFAAAWRGAPDHVRAYKRWAPLDRLVEALLAS